MRGNALCTNAAADTAVDPLALHLCRGLVLHAPSQTVVATPFTAFLRRVTAAAKLQQPGKNKAVESPQRTQVRLRSRDWESRRRASRRSGNADDDALFEAAESNGEEEEEETPLPLPAPVPPPPLPPAGPALASLKIDGSLGIAFAWEGAVRVVTKRRFDSEQALWAQARLLPLVCAASSLQLSNPLRAHSLAQAAACGGSQQPSIHIA